jgi:peptidoglycan/LPS O-acetylase OafA/YrhL
MSSTSIFSPAQVRDARESMRKNNFDLVRIILALVVVFVHSSDLCGSSQLAVFRTFLNAQMAVEGFFVISGFLIIASYERSKSLKDYCSKRARRILPGYWLASLVCVVIAASFNPHLNPVPFLLANLTFLNFLHPGISGVFTHNPGNSALDGALWTIKTEVLFYAIVPALVWACRRFGRLQVLLSIAVLSVVFRMGAVAVGHAKLGLQLPGQMSFFCLGALAYYYLPAFKRQGRLLVLFSIVCYLVYVYTGYYPLRPIFVSVITLFASLSLPQIKGPTRWGDFSYGTYVLHWPIIQTVVALGLFRHSPWLAFSIVLTAVCIAASLSWFLVERRWLPRRANHATAEKPLTDHLPQSSLVLNGPAEAHAGANPNA